jgi:CubicO group peptidase (beta-lactamase class C family)
MKLSVGDAGEVGISAIAVEGIRARCAEWVDEGVHPSLVVLAARKGVIFLHEAFGKLTPADDSPPLTVDAIVPLSSLVKPITTSCAMLLVEDGLLGLNRPVQEYIPEFTGEGKEQVMVHQLFTHTSGITDDPLEKAIESYEEGSIDPSGIDDSLHPFVHRILQLGYDLPLTNQPGEVMEYSNYGIYLIGEVTRRLSGMSLNSFASQRLFQPLGMDHTSYGLPQEQRSMYCFRPEDAPHPVYNETDFLDRPSPTSGGFSTAMDMAIFGQMFLNGGHYGDVRVFRAKYFDEEFPEAGWGLGWSTHENYKGEVYGEQLLSDSAYGHGGASGVVLWMDPERDLLFVFFSVIMQELDSRPMLGADLFMNMVAAAVVDDWDRTNIP